ncbi:hypothetical protein [Pricia sp.]|uniref:hypothetical protein n=1 Tax=Pricia sp. TaxID=2268138 RepID=UPI003593BFC2
MEKSIIDELNMILTKTLDHQEAFRQLSQTSTHGATADKLDEFAKVAKKESERLIKAISDMGGDVQTTERHTDQQTIGWVPRPLPDSKDLQALLECLIKGERNKEDDYNNLFAREDIDSELKNLLSKHRKEAESNLVYFQSALKSLEQRPERQDR